MILSLIPYCFYFAACTYIQLNDPDWRLWTTIYAIPLFLCIWATFAWSLQYKLRFFLAQVSAFLFFCTILTANNFNTWKNAFVYFAALKETIAKDEVFREQIGLLIAAISIVWICKPKSNPLESFFFRALVGTALSFLLFYAPKKMEFSGNHCGNSNNPLPLTLFENKEI